MLRQVTASHIFTGSARFQALAEAEAWLDANGYSSGPPCAENKIAVVRGRGVPIGKWRTLSRSEIAEIDGILAGNVRTGPLTLTLYGAHRP